MAKIIVGTDKGKEVKITEWILDEVLCSDRKIRRITNFTFTQEEIEQFLMHDRHGLLSNEFKLLKNNRFVRRIEE